MKPTPHRTLPERVRRGWLPRIGVLGLLLVVVVVLGLWNYTPSRRAWERYQAELAAKGELVNWTNYVAFKMPPEAENFGATPLLRRIGRRGQILMLSSRFA